MYEEYPPSGEIREWALEAARSTIWARRASRVCLGLAIAAAVFGLVGAGSMLWIHFDTGSGSDGFSMSGLGWPTTLAQASNLLVSAALPVGLLLAASAFLRLHASKFDTELTAYGEDDPSGDEVTLT